MSKEQAEKDGRQNSKEVRKTKKDNRTALNRVKGKPDGKSRRVSRDRKLIWLQKEKEPNSVERGSDVREANKSRRGSEYAEDKPREDGEVTAEDIMGMSDEDFADYMNSVKGGKSDAEPEYAEPEYAEAEGPVPESEPEETEPDNTETEYVETEDAEPEPPKPFKTFATEDEYNGAINEAVNRRFAYDRDNAKTLGRIERAFKGLDTEAGDDWIDRIVNHFDEAAAERDEVPVDEYRQKRRDSEDLQRYRAAERHINDQKDNMAKICERWKRENEELKEVAPDFDFVSAVEGNAAFKDALLKGASVAQAYLASGMAEKKPEVQPKQAKPKRAEIAQNAQTSARGTGEGRVNPASLSDKDFKAYINKIMNS